MPLPPNPVRIFHITTIANLPSIAAQRALCAKGRLARQGLDYDNIAYQGAQGTRALKQVPLPPGGVIHDYVPFYFAPRSPMLGTINEGNVPDCPYRQSDIVHFIANLDRVAAAGHAFVFYNYNATLNIAECFNSMSDLDKIDWPLFFEPPQIAGFCKFWFSTVTNPRYALRMETRQAELLVHESLPLALCQGIGTYNEVKAEEVRILLAQTGVELPVKAKPGWYF